MSCLVPVSLPEFDGCARRDRLPCHVVEVDCCHPCVVTCHPGADIRRLFLGRLPLPALVWVEFGCKAFLTIPLESQ